MTLRLLRAKAKEKQRESGGAVVQKSAKPIVDTREELAKIAGVSHDTIAKGKVIEAKASEETKASLRSGAASINAEYKKLTVHVGNNSGEDAWFTPPEFTAAARKVMGGIKLDPASCEFANRAVKADRFFSTDDDGLRRDWSGTVWLNPPYGQPVMGQFIEKLLVSIRDGSVEQACALVNNGTETAWFQDAASLASAVCFPKGRISFIDASGKPALHAWRGQASGKTKPHPAAEPDGAIMPKKMALRREGNVRTWRRVVPGPVEWPGKSLLQFLCSQSKRRDNGSDVFQAAGFIRLDGPLLALPVNLDFGFEFRDDLRRGLACDFGHEEPGGKLSQFPIFFA